MTLPTGNVTFLFTDIEGITRLWESNLTAMRIDEAEALYQDCGEIALDLANRWLIPHLLEGIGNVCRVRGENEKGLTLYAAASVLRERLGLNFAPLDEQNHSQILGDFQAKLSEPSYSQIWKRGIALSLIAAAQIAFPKLAIK